MTADTQRPCRPHARPRREDGCRSTFAAIAMTAWVAAACPAPYPDTSYYKLVPPVPTEAATDGIVMLVDELRVDAAYDDERIAYRSSPYRLEYYEYHRWSAPPGLLMSDFLRTAYANTGRFERVVREPDPDATVVLSGRVIALEEIDRTTDHWIGNVELELELRDADTRRVLWSKRIHERERLRERSPEGLANAASRALRRAVSRTAPEIAHAARVGSPGPEHARAPRGPPQRATDP
jgi:ABC-type uncharacterized transport system auxiliary subunit